MVDAAHVLTPDQIQTLSQKLTVWEKTSHHQLVIATIPSLGGDDISDYGYRLGRYWKLGRTGVDDGVILLLAPSEHQIRIEVGRGLEPVLTDDMSIRIIHTLITPKLKEKDVYGALREGSDATMAYIDKHEGEMLQKSSAKSSNEGELLDIILGALFLGAVVGGIIWWRHRRWNRLLSQMKASEQKDVGLRLGNKLGPLVQNPHIPPSHSGLRSDSVVQGYAPIPVIIYDPPAVYSPTPKVSYDFRAPDVSDSDSSSDVGFTSTNDDDSSFGGGGADETY